jgi:AraC-like DNA-binding protein
MLLVFEDRPSESPVVERVWSSYSERAGQFLSVASGLWEIAVTRYRGQTFLTVRGPETVATEADCPPDAEWFGIRFKLGTFLRPFPPGTVSDRRDVTLPGAVTRAFWLDGSAWEYPTFENADTFVARLVRRGLIGSDPIVPAVVAGDPRAVSARTLQRRFVRATGITHATFRTIERARYATALLRQGLPIIDVVGRAGYFDQAHLTRSLGRLIGQPPAEIARRRRQLSFLYKTTTPDHSYDRQHDGPVLPLPSAAAGAFPP